MGRPAGEKTRCGNNWTESKYRSFIQNLLRRGTSRWRPKQKCAEDARIQRGFYKCASCNESVPTTVPVMKNGKRVREKNIFVDHIKPVVDPKTGWTGWDDYVENLFCEADNFQLLCKSCHDAKTAEEREIRVKYRKKNNK